LESKGCDLGVELGWLQTFPLGGSPLSALSIKGASLRFSFGLSPSRLGALGSLLGPASGFGSGRGGLCLFLGASGMSAAAPSPLRRATLVLPAKGDLAPEPLGSPAAFSICRTAP
jgi:hypothetical protein